MSAPRLVLSLALCSFTFAALVSPADGAVLDVPGDQPTLVAALSAAAPGDVIFLHGGTHPPVTITKAVTIVGESGAEIDNTGFGSGDQDPNVTLAGGGSGRVALVGVDLVGSAELFVYSGMGSRIVGGGFAELLIEDCHIDPPKGVNATGAYQARHAVTVSVPTVFVSRSEITGAAGGTDGCFYAHPGISNFIGDSGAAVSAPSSTVVVLDSELSGGVGPNLCFDLSTAPPSSSTDVPSAGSGVVAKALYRANSLIQGGVGLDVYVQSVTGGFFSIGQGAAGAAVVADTVVNLDSKIDASTSPALGGTWTMSWSTSGAPTLLIVGMPAPPVEVFGHGVWFFGGGPTSMTPVPGGAQTLSLVIPANPALVGFTAAIQLHDPADGLTRPLLVTPR